MAENRAATLHSGGGGVEGLAHLCEGEKAEEENVAEEDKREKEGAMESALGPIDDARGKPVAREERKHGEARFHEHAIEHGEDARFEHFVADGFGAQPDCGDQQCGESADQERGLK